MADPSPALRRVLGPPADRLIVLDPISRVERSMEAEGVDFETVDVTG